MKYSYAQPSLPAPTPAIRVRGIPEIRDACTRWQLAASGCAQVQLCSCQSIHITVGGFTLRLPAESLVDLHALLSTALERLSAASIEAVAPSSPTNAH